MKEFSSKQCIYGYHAPRVGIANRYNWDLHWKGSPHEGGTAGSKASCPLPIQRQGQKLAMAGSKIAGLNQGQWVFEASSPARDKARLCQTQVSVQPRQDRASQDRLGQPRPDLTKTNFSQAGPGQTR